MNIFNKEHTDVSVAYQFQGTAAECKKYECRPLTKTDLQDLANWPTFDNPELSWANFPATTDKLQEKWYRNQQKDYIAWIVIRHPIGGENTLIGRCSYTEPLIDDTWLFGIVLRPDILNQGNGTTITKIMLQYAFEISEIEKVWLESRYDNKRAQRVWEKVGFQKQGDHYRREVFGRYDRYIGYAFHREDRDKLPEIRIIDTNT